MGRGFNQRSFINIFVLPYELYLDISLVMKEKCLCLGSTEEVCCAVGTGSRFEV